MATRVAKFGMYADDDARVRAGQASSFLVPLARVLFSAVFIVSGLSHFKSETVQYAASQGVPAAQVLVPLAGVLAIAGGLSVLLGLKARVGAWMLVLFLVPVTVMMHAFWAVDDPMMRQMQQIQFLKNLGLLGCAFLITYFGAGPYSVDSRRGEARRRVVTRDVP